MIHHQGKSTDLLLLTFPLEYLPFSFFFSGPFMYSELLRQCHNFLSPASHLISFRFCRICIQCGSASVVLPHLSPRHVLCSSLLVKSCAIAYIIHTSFPYFQFSPSHIIILSSELHVQISLAACSSRRARMSLTAACAERSSLHCPCARQGCPRKTRRTQTKPNQTKHPWDGDRRTANPKQTQARKVEGKAGGKTKPQKETRKETKNQHQINQAIGFSGVKKKS